MLSLLCLGTIIFSAACSRYVAFGDNLLRNPLFQEGLKDWHVQQKDSVSLHQKILTLSNAAGSNRSVSVSKTIIVPSGQRLLILSCEARALSVISGKKDWETARVILTPLTTTGKPRYDVPHTLTTLDETTPWARFEQVFHVPEDSTAVSVGIQILNASGTLEVRSIALRSASEDPTYLKWQHALTLVWLSAGLWIIWPLLRSARHETRRMWILLAGGMTLAGVLIPATVKYAITPSWLLPETEVPGSFRADLLPATVPFSLELLPTELDIYKIAHFLLFAFIGYLLIARQTFEKHTGIQVGIAGLFALATESMQSLASGRGGKLSDVLIDLCGIFVGLLFAVTVRHLASATRYRSWLQKAKGS